MTSTLWKYSSFIPSPKESLVWTQEPQQSANRTCFSVSGWNIKRFCVSMITFSMMSQTCEMSGERWRTEQANWDAACWPPSSGPSRKLRCPRQMACCATWSEQGDAESSRWSTPVWNSHKDWTHPAAVLWDWEGAAGRGKGGGVAATLGGGSPPAGPIWVEKQHRGSSISSRGSPGWPVATGETASALSYRSVCMWSARTHIFLHGLGGLKPL